MVAIGLGRILEKQNEKRHGYCMEELTEEGVPEARPAHFDADPLPTT